MKTAGGGISLYTVQDAFVPTKQSMRGFGSWYETLLRSQGRYVF